ncbi:MAG: DUF58 domain-containing protein [Chloroflexi bacterium]|nr:MAG: DUF58 domain-containing protein [Chloroflexota bacterium]
MAIGRPEQSGEITEADLLSQVRRLEIQARRLASTTIAGDYRSVFRGSGIEFAEAREYTPGDDVRLIDWNVTARTGTPWVKQYVEEREAPVICAVDVSGSQRVTRHPQGRTAVAAELTALLSFAAAYQHDRAGLLSFTDRIEQFVPPARGTKHTLRIVREVLRGEHSGQGTSLSSACDYLARVLRRRSIVFLISDFIDRDYEQALRTLARRNDVIALTLVDPLDLAMPDLGLVEFEDAETGSRAVVDTGDAAFRERYAAAAEERARTRRAILASANVDEVQIRLDQDVLLPVLAYFRQRAARR